MGSGSLKGCNMCDFGGIHFGETIKYPLYARYTIPTNFQLILEDYDGLYVDVAFIALDAENLCEETEDQFTFDFGDKKFPYYKGNNSIRLTEELIDEDNPINHESDIQVQQCFVLKEYIPPSC